MTMRKTKLQGMALVMLALMALPALAQKQFTLEDLNFGGTNYRNMVPANKSLTWWGDQLVRLSNDTCWTVDPVKGKEKVLFTRDGLNRALSLKEAKQISSLSYASFPYPDKPVALLYNNNERLLVNFTTNRMEWRGDRPRRHGSRGVEQEKPLNGLCQGR